MQLINSHICSTTGTILELIKADRLAALYWNVDQEIENITYQPTAGRNIWVKKLCIYLQD